MDCLCYMFCLFCLICMRPAFFNACHVFALVFCVSSHACSCMRWLYLVPQFHKDTDIVRDRWFCKPKNQKKILTLLKLLDSDAQQIVVRRRSERGVNAIPKRTCATYGDQEELFLFKEERIKYLHDLTQFLLRHNTSACKKVRPDHRKAMYAAKSRPCKSACKKVRPDHRKAMHAAKCCTRLLCSMCLLVNTTPNFQWKCLPVLRTRSTMISCGSRQSSPTADTVP